MSEKKIFAVAKGWPINDDEKGYTDVGSYRIWVVFLDKQDRKIFLELTNCTSRLYHGSEKIPPSDWFNLWCDRMLVLKNPKIQDHEITMLDWQAIRKKYRYTKKDILAFINSQFDTEYTSLVITNLTDSKAKAWWEGVYF